jgi:acyl-CoA thioesterase
MSLEAARRFLDADRFAQRADIQLLIMEPGHATARMAIQPYHLNGLQTVEGGAIFTLADLVFAAASNAHGTVAVAINCSINFIKAATTGTLFAEARELSRNFRLGTYLVEVKDDQGDLVAVFQGLAYRKSDPIPSQYSP